MSTQQHDTNQQTVFTDRQDRYVLEIAHPHADNIGVNEGDTVSLRLFNFEGSPTFEIMAGDTFPLTRMLRKPNTQHFHITLPKTVISILGLHDNRVTVSSDSSKIIAAIENSPHLTSPANVHTVGTDTIYQRGNVYVNEVPKHDQFDLDADSTVWVWADTLEESFALGVDTDHADARDTATDLTISDKGDAYELVIPKTLVDALARDDIDITWGYSGSRMIGLFD